MVCALRPTVVVAATQRRGVGRGSRRWVSPVGGLYLNWLSSELDDGLINHLPMLAASAALRAVNEAGIANAVIKWPNDILVDGGKLAGILVHARRGDVNCVTVGLGVNVDPISEPLADALHPPISLAELIGADGAADRAAAIAIRFVAALNESLVDAGPALDRWRRHLVHRVGDALSVRLASGTVINGTFGGLTGDGYLRVVTSTGDETIVTSGDVIE